MPKKKNSFPKINYFQLILGLLLNITVIIVALIIYNDVIRNNGQDGNGAAFSEPAMETPFPSSDATP